MMEKINRKKDGRSSGSTSRGSASGRDWEAPSRGSSASSVSQLVTSLPDSSTETFKGYDLRAHLKQILTFSDDEEDYSSDEESTESFDGMYDSVDEELRQLAEIGPTDGQPQTPRPTKEKTCQSLMAINRKEGDELDSEEENEIMKEIKNEITNNIRGEMKSELELYKAKMDKLDRQAGGEADGSKDDANADLDELEPKMKAAIVKMRKLDKILSKRVRREKEVKRDRILLERRIRREIDELNKAKQDEYKEVLVNEQKFLALELPPRHNEGVTVPDEFTGEEVFATQLNEDEYPGLHSHRSKGKSRAQGRSGQSPVSTATGKGDTESQATDNHSVHSGSTDGRNRKKKKKKDFIKRNKELAADAQNLIAMTEEEKKRLEDLLMDVDTLQEVPEDIGDMDDVNPFQIAVKPGEGFHPDQDEARSLTSIDSRLKELLPPSDYESIASTSALSHAPQHKLFTHTGVKHAIDWESRGEQALFQNAEQREMNERMLAIDSELSRIKNREDELDTPLLGEDQLHDLIEQCVTSLSMSSMSRLASNSRSSMADTESLMSHQPGGPEDGEEETPRSPRSARQDILDNPPRLDPSVLQQLLAEAYHPLSKHLTTLQEENEEDEETTPIPADVWKLIAEEKVGDEDIGDSVKEREDSTVGVGEQSDKPLLNIRNGFTSLSRNSSSSSLASAVEIGRESREREPLKLPEIDPTGTLVTQGLNNQRAGSQQRPGSGASSARTPINIVRNSWSDSIVDNGQGDSRLEVMSIDSEIMSPHPPRGEKRDSSASKSRTVNHRINAT